MLKQLRASTRALHQRFDVFPPQPVPALNVFKEEAREVVEAARVITTIKKLPTEQRSVDDLVAPKAHLAEEIVDTLVTLCALMDAHEVSWPELKRASRAVIEKNAAKTDVTHAVNKAGKIQRRKVETTER